MRILFIEDDRTFSGAVSAQLRKAGYHVDCAYDGECGLEKAISAKYDLILLDRMLPKTDGAALLKTVREQGVSAYVIFLTALGSLPDRIDGLYMGADDYIAKPFEIRELLAKLCAVKRRIDSDENTNIQAFDLTLYPSSRTLCCNSASVQLTNRENAVMELFMRRPGQIVHREMLLTAVWGSCADVENGNIDNYIHFLRRRLRALNSKCVFQTVYGIGYRLEA